MAVAVVWFGSEFQNTDFDPTVSILAFISANVLRFNTVELRFKNPAMGLPLV